MQNCISFQNEKYRSIARLLLALAAPASLTS
jgi:hypothetical protein